MVTEGLRVNGEREFTGDSTCSRSANSGIRPDRTKSSLIRVKRADVRKRSRRPDIAKRHAGFIRAARSGPARQAAVRSNGQVVAPIHCTQRFERAIITLTECSPPNASRRRRATASLSCDGAELPGPIGPSRSATNPSTAQRHTLGLNESFDANDVFVLRWLAPTVGCQPRLYAARKAATSC